MIKAEIYDLDNLLYRDPENKNEIFLAAAIEAACQILGAERKVEIESAASRSYARYGTDFAVFVEEFGVEERVIHPLYHSLAMADIFAKISPDPEIQGHMEDRLRAGLPVSIITHGSQEWLRYALNKLELERFFPENCVFAVDHPAIDYKYKNLSLHAFSVASEAMGITDLTKIRFYDDSRSNLEMAHRGGIETVWVHWGQENTSGTEQYISRRIRKVSDFKLI